MHTDCREYRTVINTLLSLAAQLNNETLMKNICDVLDIDYEKIKDKLPDPDEADKDLSKAQDILDGVNADDERTEGGTPEPTE